MARRVKDRAAGNQAATARRTQEFNCGIYIETPGLLLKEGEGTKTFPSRFDQAVQGRAGAEGLDSALQQVAQDTNL